MFLKSSCRVLYRESLWQLVVLLMDWSPRLHAKFSLGFKSLLPLLWSSVFRHLGLLCRCCTSIFGCSSWNFLYILNLQIHSVFLHNFVNCISVCIWLLSLRRNVVYFFYPEVFLSVCWLRGLVTSWYVGNQTDVSNLFTKLLFHHIGEIKQNILKARKIPITTNSWSISKLSLSR